MVHNNTEETDNKKIWKTAFNECCTFHTDTSDHQWQWIVYTYRVADSDGRTINIFSRCAIVRVEVMQKCPTINETAVSFKLLIIRWRKEYITQLLNHIKRKPSYFLSIVRMLLKLSLVMYEFRNVPGKKPQGSHSLQSDASSTRRRKTRQGKSW